MVEPSPGEVHRARVAADREARRVRLAGCEPAAVLREWLSLLRDGHDGRRQTGHSFESAWPEALARTCKGLAGEGWRQIFTEQEDAWRRAWERGPQTRGERALSVLLADLDRTELVGDGEELLPDGEPARTCAHCDGAMTGRARQARYCSAECERAAARERQRHQRAGHHTGRAGELSRGARESSPGRVAA